MSTASRPDPGPAGITVFHKNVPAKLPPGPVLVIEPTTATDLWTIGEVQQNPIVTKQDKDSPLMAHVRLDNVLMPEARQLKINAPKVQVLATSLTNDPLYAAIDRPEGKVLVLTVNLEKGDLPLQTAFPIMVANALGWFAGTKGELARVALDRASSPTSSLPPSAEAGERWAGLVAPDGRIETTARRGQQGDGRPARPVRRLVDRPAPDEGPEIKIEAKLGRRSSGSEAAAGSGVQPGEPARERPPLNPLAKTTAPSGVAGRRGFGGWPIWVVLCSMALALAGLEWYLYQRRWIS